MTAFAASQLLICLAICTDTLSFQCRTRTRILACLLTSCILIVIHFALLGYWTAVGLGLLAGLRYLISLRTSSRTVLWIFLGTVPLIFLLTFDGILSVIACFGSLATTIGTFCADDRRLRYWMLAGGTLWLIHNALAHSPMAVLMEGMFVGSNLVGIYRFYLRRTSVIKG